MEENTDRIGNLSEWYSEQILGIQEKVKPHSNYLFKGIKIFTSLPLILLGIVSLYFLIMVIIGIFTGFGGAGEAFSRIGKMWIFAFIISLIYFSWAWLIYLLAWEKINSFEMMKNKGKIFEIGEGKARELKEMIIELAIKMNVDFRDILFWSTINKETFPSVEVDKFGKINLLLPLNFIHFFEQNKPEAKAILAHELGHVLQHDTKIYLETDSYFEVIRMILFPLGIFNLLIHLYLLFASGNYAKIAGSDPLIIITCIIFIWDITLIVYLYNGFKILREARRDSERLADTAAVLYADGSSLISVLERIKNDFVKHKSNATHPDKMDRIENINSVLKLN
jgi:hypothetical protein